MRFDRDSRAETFPEFPQYLIDEHLIRHNNNDYKYTGLTRSQLRNKLITSGVKCNSEGERSEYEKSVYEKSEAGIDGERDTPVKMSKCASPSYTNKTSATSIPNRGGEEVKEPEF
jgi:hypothetical protein